MISSLASETDKKLTKPTRKNIDDSVKGMLKSEVWTGRKLKLAARYLSRNDESIAKALKQRRAAIPVDRLLPETDKDLFSVLTRSIVYQQLSNASASAIWKRFMSLSGDSDKVRAKDVKRSSVEQMRSVGLSRQKAGYLKGIADEFVSGKLSDDIVSKMTTDEISRRLMNLKGVGVWTVHMVEIFHLGRQDVLPVGDLAVLRGIQKLYGLEKPPTKRQAEALTEHWKPYRSLGSFYMWAL